MNYVFIGILVHKIPIIYTLVEGIRNYYLCKYLIHIVKIGEYILHEDKHVGG